MRVVAQSERGSLLLVDMEDGTARTLDPARHSYFELPSVESALARGGWRAPPTDASVEAVMADARPAEVAL